MKRNLIFVTVIAFVWIVVAVGLIVSKQFIIWTGTKVVLETVPVDPRDFLRGDYVILDYKISTLDLTEIDSDRTKTQYSSGEVVYVKLKPAGEYWEAVGIKCKRDKDTDTDERYIKGKVKYYSDGETVRVNYGIESYFVPEGQGKDIERSLFRGSNAKVKVEVYVSRLGDALVDKIYINDKEVTFR